MLLLPAPQLSSGADIFIAAGRQDDPGSTDGAINAMRPTDAPLSVEYITEAQHLHWFLCESLCVLMCLCMWVYTCAYLCVCACCCGRRRSLVHLKQLTCKAVNHVSAGSTAICLHYDAADHSVDHSVR